MTHRNLLVALLAAAASSLPSGAGAQGVTHHFDQFSAGTILNDMYVPWGVTLGAQTDGDVELENVVADETCNNLEPGSRPNVLSPLLPAACPDFTSLEGKIVAVFATPQRRVSFVATLVSASSFATLDAFDSDDLLVEQAFLFGAQFAGVPTPIEVSDPDPRIVRVEAYAPAGGGSAVFDDLSYDELPVPTSTVNWSALKTRFRSP